MRAGNDLLLVLALVLVGVGGVYLFMKTSKRGVSEIKRYEALRLRPYKDAGGKWTIGYGHLLKRGEWWDEISEEKAEDLLRGDLAIAESAVEKLVTVSLTRTQRDSLISFVFNVGVDAFAKSTMLRKLNSGDYAGAANEFSRWRYVQGQVNDVLVARRAREQALFVA
jgi:lysozyme